MSQEGQVISTVRETGFIKLKVTVSMKLPFASFPIFFLSFLLMLSLSDPQSFSASYADAALKCKWSCFQGHTEHNHYKIIRCAQLSLVSLDIWKEYCSHSNIMQKWSGLILGKLLRSGARAKEEPRETWLTIFPTLRLQRALTCGPVMYQTHLQIHTFLLGVKVTWAKCCQHVSKSNAN